MQKIETEWIARSVDAVKDHVRAHLRGLPVQEVVSFDRVEALARELAQRASQAVFEAWTARLEEVAIAAGASCPRCSGRRKVKRRPGAPMTLSALGVEVSMPKLYLECARCGVGVSITRLLTGVSSGDKSGELELMAAYCGAEHSYGKASRDLEVHHGQPIERTAVRRMALVVEHSAMEFAEKERSELLAQLAEEQRREGKPQLMVTGDGGIVRTGTLVACERGDPGYDKKTPKTERKRRKRVTQYREIITLDVREPGETTTSALDVVVPITAAQDERSRRMLALAARKGLGDNTEVFGLGDMGSRLAESFDEAFVGRDPEAVYSADWKHTVDYVENAAALLEGPLPQRWTKAMKDALWNRERKRADRLIASARARRVSELPHHVDKCSVEALATYVANNWERLRAKEFKDKGLEFVSGRAESQVRDRTKSRYAVAGAWNEQNLEGKAILRSIIADGRWPAFRAYYLRSRYKKFDEGLAPRLREAVAQGRIGSDVLVMFGVSAATEEVLEVAA
jgi:DNA-directed RNA polymerase subunit RPC12/RpoP